MNDQKKKPSGLEFWGESGSSPPKKKLYKKRHIAAYTEPKEIVTDEKLELLTTEEAASYLKVTVGEIYNFVSDGKLKPLKLGTRNRFLVSGLNKLLVNG